MSSWSYSKHLHKAEKKAKTEKKLAQLEKMQGLRPVTIEGSVIARTWWGKAWNENLESSAEYSQIGRGRSDVRSGAVIDLQVSAGGIRALVQGSRAKPYAATITVKKLNKNTWNLVAAACKGKLVSLEELLAGKFSKAVEETFLHRRTGLFPSPKEIEFACTCPDWTSMCKHISATLYGMGARLDDDPMLFFTLRGADPVDLIKRDVSSEAESLLQKLSKKSSRTSEGAGLSAARGAGPGKEAGSTPSNGAVEIQPPGEESVRMADVRKVLKQQLKMDCKLAKKEKPSKTSGAKKNIVKGTANEIVHKVVNKRLWSGKKK
jgi:uncharacterized Zn finger protein